MRRAVLIVFCICLTACVKTTLPRRGHVTRAEIRSCRSQYDYFGAITAPDKLSVLLDFIDRPRPSWTRTFVFDFGVLEYWYARTYTTAIRMSAILRSAVVCSLASVHSSKFGAGTFSLASPCQYRRQTNLLISSAPVERR